MAIDGLFEVHVTTRPVSTLPLASLGNAVSGVVPPTATVAVDGCTVTDATGTVVTVMIDVPDWPSLVAVTVVVPAALQ